MKANNSTDCVVLSEAWVDKYYDYHIVDITFGIFALVANTLLAIVLLKFGKLRNTYRFTVFSTIVPPPQQ